MNQAGTQPGLRLTCHFLCFCRVALWSQGGVRRVHLLDSSLEGALLLELYTRDGIGTMVSRYTHRSYDDEMYCYVLSYDVLLYEVAV